MGSLDVVEDNRQADTLENRVVVHIGHVVAYMSCQSLTFLGRVGHPLGGFQVFHHVCPSQLCVVSAKYCC